LGDFHTLLTLDLHQYICGFQLNHLSPCAEIFFYFLDFWRYFLSDFRSCDFKHLRFEDFVSSSPNPRFLELIQNRKGNLWIWEKNSFRNVFLVLR
jgi:hypothetical protein